MLWNCLFGSHVAFHKKQFYTRCTQNLLNDTQHSHSINQSCFLKRKKHKMLQSKKPIKQRSSRRKSAPLTSVIKPSHSFLDLSSLKLFEHEWTNNTFTKSHSIKMRLFHASRIVQTKLNCMMITDKHSQTLIFWCQKISFSDLKLEDTPS